MADVHETAKAVTDADIAECLLHMERAERMYRVFNGASAKLHVLTNLSGVEKDLRTKIDTHRATLAQEQERTLEGAKAEGRAAAAEIVRAAQAEAASIKRQAEAELAERQREAQAQIAQTQQQLETLNNEILTRRAHLERIKATARQIGSTG